jgi:hypothetical protein
VDDHQSTYLTKLKIKNLEKKKKKKKRPYKGLVHFQIFKKQEPEVIIQQIK